MHNFKLLILDSYRIIHKTKFTSGDEKRRNKNFISIQLYPTQ